ncbi:hypothetical protein FQA39_LY08971 [Lamprigera yunnana]|nr:hypothetical protein FQA39_LY08971 [Lamprigera yunnana]
MTSHDVHEMPGPTGNFSTTSQQLNSSNVSGHRNRGNEDRDRAMGFVEIVLGFARLKGNSTTNWGDNGRAKIVYIEDINTISDYKEIENEDCDEKAYTKTIVVEGNPFDEDDSHVKIIWVENENKNCTFN